MEAQPNRFLVHGLIAGFAAYASTVVLYAGINLATGRAVFATALQLGEAMFGTGVPPAGQVIAYNGVHLLVMLLLGLVCAWAVREWELHPVLWYGVFAVLTLGAVVLTLWVGLFASEYARALQWRSVVVANAVAAAVMASYLVLSAGLRVEE